MKNQYANLRSIKLVIHFEKKDFPLNTLLKEYFLEKAITATNFANYLISKISSSDSLNVVLY